LKIVKGGTKELETELVLDPPHKIAAAGRRLRDSGEPPRVGRIVSHSWFCNARLTYPQSNDVRLLLASVDKHLPKKRPKPKKRKLPKNKFLLKGNMLRRAGAFF